MKPPSPSISQPLSQPHSQTRIETLYERACLAELAALKIGNTHIWGGGKTPLPVFQQAARVTKKPMGQRGYCVGQKIYHSAVATKKAVGENPNMGMLLLAAPLIKTFEEYQNCHRQNLEKVLARLTLQDANYTFKALRLLKPKSLARTHSLAPQARSQDAFKTATLPLKQVMELVQGEDLIAYQYANGFENVYEGCGFFANHNLANRKAPHKLTKYKLAPNKLTNHRQARHKQSPVLAHLAALLHLKFVALGDTHIKKAYSPRLAKQAAKIAASTQKAMGEKAIGLALAPKLTSARISSHSAFSALTPPFHPPPSSPPFHPPHTSSINPPPFIPPLSSPSRIPPLAPALRLLYAQDRKLKQLGANPGASADLTFASLLVAFLDRWW